MLQQILVKVNNTVPFAIRVEVMMLLHFSGDGRDSVTPSAKRHDSEYPPPVEGMVTVFSASGSILHCSRQFVILCLGQWFKLHYSISAFFEPQQ